MKFAGVTGVCNIMFWYKLEVAEVALEATTAMDGQLCDGWIAITWAWKETDLKDEQEGGNGVKSKENGRKHVQYMFEKSQTEGQHERNISFCVYENLRKIKIEESHVRLCVCVCLCL